MASRIRSVPAIALFTLFAAGCASHPPGEGRSGMVVTADSIASMAGLAVLERGGNAVDAAVAVGFTLAVTYPEAGNIGGGGFMLIRLPDGTSRSIDFREMAPRGSSAGMYLENPGASVDGCLAAGVPGTVAGLLLALEKYGTMDRVELLQPAIALAEEGFRVNDSLASGLVEYRSVLAAYPSTRGTFFRDTLTLRAGDLLVQTDLAATLRRIADSGAAGFYSGRTASLIASHMASCGGIIDTSDLAAYRATERPVLRGRYRGYDIDVMGPPSSGGPCILEALALLEPYDLGRLGFHTPASVHLIAEAMKRAFSMRAAWLGDPDFVDIPVDELLRPGHAGDGTSMGIDTSRAVPAADLAGFPGLPHEGSQTTHYAVVDRNGMAAAVTTTINDLFGNKAVVEGAGFFMNDEMDDFVTIPGGSNMYGLVGGPENMISPGKRPLSSMSPLIVSKDGKPLMVLGARGGSKIITAVLQVLINVVDFRLSPREAVAAPRFHHQWNPDTLWFERGAFGPGTGEELFRRGHSIAELSSGVGMMEAVFIDPATGMLMGVPDPREGGTAAGY